MLPDGGTAAGHEAARRLNLTIARANASAVDLPRVVAPAIGSAVGGDVLETLLVGELLAGKPADVGTLAAELTGVLGRSGRSVQRDGKPVTDQAETLRIVTDAVVAMLERRLPVLRRLGVPERMTRSRYSPGCGVWPWLGRHIARSGHGSTSRCQDRRSGPGSVSCKDC